MMKKIDLTKLYKSYYTARTRPEILHIEAAQYLSIRGKGDPSGEAYAAWLQALYAAAYTLKFACKARGFDFTVAKLEALWWFDEAAYGHIPMQEAPQQIPRSEWEYRMLIRLPDEVSETETARAIDEAFRKKGDPDIREVELYRMTEGKVVQALHHGPFDKEPETLAGMQEFIQAHGFQKNGHHHEIYLSDFRKTAPEKLKTILREPVK